MDFDFSNMTHAAAEAKCRDMWNGIVPDTPIIDNYPLLSFLTKDPGFHDRATCLHGVISVSRRINKRTGATTFYAKGSDGGETWMSWPNALRAVMGMEMAPRSPWDAVFNAFYDKVKSVIHDEETRGQKMVVSFTEFLFAWMTINGYSKADLSFNTPENVGRFSVFFSMNATFANTKKREADTDAEAGPSKEPRASIE